MASSFTTANKTKQNKKTEAIKASTDGQMHKENVIYTHKGIGLGLRRKDILINSNTGVQLIKTLY